MSHRPLAAALGLILVAVLLPAAAALAACTISTTAVTFGTYNVFSLTPLDSTGSIVFRCGNDRNIRIALDKGGAPTFDPRRMLQGSETLDYNLFLDASRTIIWGDGTSGSQAFSMANPPNNQNVTVTIFGRIPAGQDVSAGAYTNTITATITF